MKIKAIPSVIVLAISAVIAYGLYSFCISDNAILLAVFGGVMLFAMLVTAFGVTFNHQGKSVNIKVVSLVFFVLALIGNIVFARCAFNIPTYIIVNSLLVLIWLLVVYGISKANS